MTKQQVIDLDDSFENRNWLRIVDQMRQGKTRKEAIEAISDGEAPNHTPCSIMHVRKADLEDDVPPSRLDE